MTLDIALSRLFTAFGRANAKDQSAEWARLFVEDRRCETCADAAADQAVRGLKRLPSYAEFIELVLQNHSRHLGPMVLQAGPVSSLDVRVARGLSPADDGNSLAEAQANARFYEVEHAAARERRFENQPNARAAWEAAHPETG